MSEASSLEAAAADLVPRARRGDAGALEQLLGRCRGTVFQWALVQTGEAADAEDVTQEVLIRLHGSLHRFAGRSRFTTWLFQVTRNEASNLRRRLGSRRRLAEAATREAEAEPVTTDDPADRVHAARVAAFAEGLMRSLPRRQREVFHLADLEGCTVAEIAERLGTSPVTARVHLFHARRAVRAGILERWPELAAEEGR
ncbi:MAG TPA: sigma-70 family RNA polymerase sigma factor [Gemmatimonadales bacterium]|nr:sigma-70 family RNA polymerase sigma factor [Gemmatimonadales bacterium]